MEKIKKDYMRGQSKRLIICAIVMVVSVIVLWLIPETFSNRTLLLILLGMAVLLAFVALCSAKCAHNLGSKLSDSEAYALEKEYTDPHSVYKFRGVEIHLMQNYIMSIGNDLTVIPIHKIKQVKPRGTRHTLCYLITLYYDFYVEFIMDDRKPITISFLPKHAKDIEPLVSQLEDRLGSEKIVTTKKD